MKCRVLLLLVVIFAMSAVLFGQTGLTGKWQTDNVPAALEAEKAAQGQPAPEPGARGGRGGGGGQAIIMDLKADAGKVTGTITEIGNPPVLNIETGTIEGNKITFVTQPRGVTWHLYMTDANTLTLTSRVFAARGGGGAGGGGGRGGGAPGGLGGAQAGGPPAGGGGAPGGAPAGGGGGGGRGGGGGGRGPAAPIVLHRVK